MIISHGLRYVFVHIPKTGGTAMTLALEARAMKDDILIADTPKAQRRKHRLETLQPSGRLWKHSKLEDIDGIVPAAELAQMMVFTLVRNPWDRIVSYYHWLRDQKFEHPAVRLAQTVDFKSFVHDPATAAALRSNSYATYVRPAVSPVFVRLEHLDEDLAPVSKHLEFAPELLRVNASDRARDWRGYYGAAEAERVASICAVDIAKFDYAFES